MKRPSLELDPNVNRLAADASLPAPEEVDAVHLTATLVCSVVAWDLPSRPLN
jgi:hypothetical protein